MSVSATPPPTSAPGHHRNIGEAEGKARIGQSDASIPEQRAKRIPLEFDPLRFGSGSIAAEL